MMPASGLCETCEAGHWEHSWFAGTPVFVHADGTREIYYECDCVDDEEGVAMSEEASHAANVAERNRRSAALNALGDEARCCAHEHDASYIWQRLERRGTARTFAEVQAIRDAYDDAPHCHAVYTIHFGTRPCALGPEHRGCCPGTPGCDHPGWYPDTLDEASPSPAP